MQLSNRRIYPFVARAPRGLRGLGEGELPATFLEPLPGETPGLGFDPSALLPIASALLGPGGGGGGGGGGAMMPGGGGVTVSPAIQTQISPQISPVFQQSFQPSGSPMTAGTTQTSPSAQSATTGQPGMPSLPTAGGMPGVLDTGLPFGGAPAGDLYSQSQPSFLQQYGLPLAIGAGVIGLLLILKKKKKGA